MKRNLQHCVCGHTKEMHVDGHAYCEHETKMLKLAKGDGDLMIRSCRCNKFVSVKKE